jgi:hypothetical protein
MVAGVELAYVTHEIAADHPVLAAPARVIAIRTQGDPARPSHRNPHFRLTNHQVQG